MLRQVLPAFFVNNILVMGDTILPFADLLEHQSVIQYLQRFEVQNALQGLWNHLLQNCQAS